MKNQTLIEHAMTTLKENGFKYTKKREAIITYLVKRNRYLPAKEIHHFICTVCGKTKELHICPMDFFQEQLPGCLIEGHRFEILGRCEECQ